ncbi:hypothetical protein AB0F88_22540 [Streptosporangium sp. NPDC023963]|uniref:hypothetical protein n=1 Tax=Streptosporangium sp. NPDC023963 TaxID=3155608 RepID=UPI00343C1BDB
MDLYRLLEVDPTADAPTIKEALTKQRRKWVSRASSASDLGRRQEAERMVEMLDLAEQKLLDARERAEYDRRQAEQPVQGPRTAPVEDPEQWMAQAEANIRAGNPHLALHEIEQALRIDHLQPRYHAVRGDAFDQVGAWEQGLAAYRTAHELDRRDPLYQALLGQHLLRRSLHSDALPLLESALATGGATPEIRTLLGMALAGLADQMADHLTDGTPVVVHPQQAAEIARLTARALDLAPPDDRLGNRLRHLHSLALAAPQKVFDWKRLVSGAGSALSVSAGMGCGCLVVTVGGMFAILIGLFSVLANGGPGGSLVFLPLAALAGGIGLFCYRPRWQVTERDTRPYRIPRTH